MTRSVVVTGASGFIGSHLSRRLLEQGCEVFALHIPTCDLSALPDHPFLHLRPTTGEVKELKAILQEAKPMVVVHLASLILGSHGEDEVGTLIDSNVRFGACLLEAMRASGVQNIVNAGTSWQHYDNAAYNPVNLYAATKQAFEDVLTYYVEAHQLSATTLYLFDTYGPNDRRPKVLNLLFQAAVTQTALDISPGEQRLDLVHVDDVCRAFLIAIDMTDQRKGTHERFAVSSGRTVSLRELVKGLNAIAPRAAIVNWGARHYREREVMTPWVGGEKVPGWEPKVGLAEGLKQLVEEQVW